MNREQIEKDLLVDILNTLKNSVPSLKEKPNNFKDDLEAILVKADDEIPINQLKVIQKVESLVRMKDYLHLLASYPSQAYIRAKVRFEYYNRIFSHFNGQIRKFKTNKGELIGLGIDEKVLEDLEWCLAFHLADFAPHFTSDKRSLSLEIEASLMRGPSNNLFKVPEEMWEHVVDSVKHQVSDYLGRFGEGIQRIAISGIGSERVARELLERRHVLHLSASSHDQPKKEIRGFIQSRTTSQEFYVIVESGDEKIDLFDIRIPMHGLLVLFTQSEKVADMMEVDLEIRMGDRLLPWELFCSYIGHSVHSSPSIEGNAVLLVKACTGNLSAIMLLANCLRHAHNLWDAPRNLFEVAISKLKLADEKGSVMFCVLKIIWDQMDDITKHSIKHWSSLSFPVTKNTLLQELVLKGFIDKVEDGASILQEVLSRLLLEEVDPGTQLFLMPPETKTLLTDKFEAPQNNLHLRQGGLQLTETPKDEQWEAKEIELHKNKLSRLPNEPNCRYLKKLLLHENKLLMNIPKSFFKNMPLLQTLDLSYTSIKALAPSVCNLVSLQTFNLRGCELLMELPPEIGALVNLEVFDLEGTELMYLPREIGELTRLKCFKVSLCPGFDRYAKSNVNVQKIIPEEVFSKFSRMHELSIVLSTDGEWSEDLKPLLKELTSLKNMKIIQLDLPSDQLLQPKGQGDTFTYSHFRRFRFTVGCQRERIISRLPDVAAQRFKKWEASRNCLKYINGETISAGITEVLEHTDVLFLDRHWTVKALSEFGTNNMKKLKCCLLVECNELETIIDWDQKDPPHGKKERAPLMALQFLGIHRMKNFQQIWRGPIPKKSLSMLFFLHLHSCPNLKTVFTRDLCANFQSLERLIVEDCPEIHSLMTQQSSNLDSSSCSFHLPNLKHLSLLHLPELDSISGGLCQFPALESLLVYDCPKLQTILSVDIPNGNVRIIGEMKWWIALKWPDNMRPKFEELEGGKDLRDHVAKLTYPKSMI